MKIPLYDYQKEAVRAMLSGRVLNTSDIGSGKSLMALGCIEALGAKINLCVAPKSLLGQWEGEVQKFMPYIRTYIVSGTATKRLKVYAQFKAETQDKILIISYETLRIDMGHLASTTFDVAIFDECHKLKEPNTILKKKLKFLIAKYRFGLSGSPVVNHYGNTYNILGSLKPHLFDNYWRFVNTYTIKTIYKGALIFRNPEEVRKIFAPHIVQKTLADAGKSLPDLQEIEVPIIMSDKEMKIYEKMRHEFIFEFEEGDITKLSSPVMLQNTLAKIGKLQEVADHLSLVGDHTESSKLDALKEIIEDQVLDTEKVIIFTRFSRMAELLAEEFKASLITGSVNNRAEVLSFFKNNGKILVMTNAGKEGLNIQEANVVIMYDQDYTATGMEQRVGRSYRLGQEKPVRVYHLLCKGTIDYRIRKMLDKKRSLAEELEETVRQLLLNN